MLDTHGSSQSQLILRNQMDLAFSTSRVFSLQDVEAPHSMVHSQLDSYNQNWTSQQPTCQLISASALPPTINSPHTTKHYPFINCTEDIPPYPLSKYPPLSNPSVHYTYTHPTVSSQPQHACPSAHHSEFLSHTSLLSQLSKPNLFNKFLHTWAEKHDNPSLH
jgi:hypothetical protein